MFTRIRWRLVAWTMAVLTLILLTLGTAIYAALSHALLDQVDRNLASRSDQAAANLDTFARSPRVDRDHDEHEGYRGGVYYLVLGPDGSVLANPQQVNLAGLPLASLPRPGPASRG